MKDLSGKTAFITGAASGIGYGMAEAFLDEGMRVVITDVQQDALDTAAKELGAHGEVVTIRLDVTDRDAWARAADDAQAKVGNIHVLCLNAGVTQRGRLDRASYDDWDWVLGVNLGGVINGVVTMVQRMEAHGEPGHIVTTASAAGLVASPGNGVYNVAKYGVVGLSETLRKELERFNIGVSVLCPGAVQTGINEAFRNRPANLAKAGNVMTDEQMELMHKSFEGGSTPREIGDYVVGGIKRNEMYMLPHAEFKPVFEKRAEEVLSCFTTDAPDPTRVANNKYRVEGFAKFWEE